MERNDALYQAYCAILREELVPATGCTEPIALAYCAAKARHALGRMPDRVRAQVSGNIIKNVKSVTVPNTGGQKGIRAAVAAGIVAGNEGAGLEALGNVTPDQIRDIERFAAETPIEVVPLESGVLLDMIVTVWSGEHEASVRISHSHTHIVSIRVDGNTLFSEDGSVESTEATVDYALLTVEDICAFADCLDPDDVSDVLDRQIECNTAIAAEGLKSGWGADIGNVLLDTYGSDVRVRARAQAAAGSDARMSGCEMPVVINSGSGNQGITVSVPVVIYAQEWNVGREKLLRALVVANLTAVHQKNYIGSLSAYCGVVSAACGAACGICYLLDYPHSVLCGTITNTIATVGGMVCDGAKSSCAAKISTALQTALLGMKMSVRNRAFQPGEGLVKGDVEQTISSFGRMGRDGMKATDNEILNIMLGN